MTPTWVIGTFMLVGISFLIAGFLFVQESNKVIEISTQYDGEGTDAKYSSCQINKDVCVRNCLISFKAPADMKAPVFVYYELHNFYQNHRRYVKSRNDAQLMGTVVPNATLQTSCDPKYLSTLTGAVYNPCGLIANSMFNDVYTIDTSTKDFSPLKESGIAWPSDRDNKFKNPPNYGAPGYIWLYETYPEIVNKAKSEDVNSANYNGGGVMNEHFIVWMRTAALSTFRKLYGSITKDVNKGIIYKYMYNWYIYNPNSSFSSLLPLSLSH